MNAVINVGAGIFQIGEYGEALPYFRTALDLATGADDRQTQAQALINIGACLLMTGRSEEAEDPLRRSLDLSADVDQTSAVLAMAWLACLELVTGRIDEAAASCLGALETSMDVYVANARECLYIAAGIASERDQADLAMLLFGAAQGSADMPLHPAKSELLRPFVERAREAAADPDDRYSAGREMPIERAVDEATALLRDPGS